MAQGAKTENIINISDSDSVSSPPPVIQPEARVSTRSALRGGGSDSMSGIRGSHSSGKKTFQTSAGPGQGLKQQQRCRVKEVSGPCFLPDPEMERELWLCLRQLHCSEDMAGYRLRKDVISEMEQLIQVWVREEAARVGADMGSQARLVCFGSFKLSVIDCESDLDLLCVVPRHVTRTSFFTSLYHRLQNKVGTKG